MRTISTEHLKMHDDGNLIQAVTASKIRLPRLWANRKDMKKHSYLDRFSTTCRNDSTMSSKWTGNKSGNRLQHEGNASTSADNLSCENPKMRIPSVRLNRPTAASATAFASDSSLFPTPISKGGDQSGDRIRKWRDSYSKTCLSTRSGNEHGNRPQQNGSYKVTAK